MVRTPSPHRTELLVCGRSGYRRGCNGRNPAHLQQRAGDRGDHQRHMTVDQHTGGDRCAFFPGAQRFPRTPGGISMQLTLVCIRICAASGFVIFQPRQPPAYCRWQCCLPRTCTGPGLCWMRRAVSCSNAPNIIRGSSKMVLSRHSGGTQPACPMAGLAGPPLPVPLWAPDPTAQTGPAGCRAAKYTAYRLRTQTGLQARECGPVLQASSAARRIVDDRPRWPVLHLHQNLLRCRGRRRS